jgi:hypothetical protein
MGWYVPALQFTHALLLFRNLPGPHSDTHAVREPSLKRLGPQPRQAADEPSMKY